jgi:pSer/pThr/pTyr-binding forkhead associated (FHA) protein
VDLAAIVASAGVGLVASIVASIATARITARQQMQHWRIEMAEKYAALRADQPANAQALVRQFAIGVLIVEPGNPDLRAKVLVAPYTRMTAGRAAGNEIVLQSEHASRMQFAVSADARQAFVEDLGSHRTLLNGRRVDTRTPLRTGDVIWVGDGPGGQVEFQALSPI